MDDPKRYYRLWWEYLRRNEDYADYCDYRLIRATCLWPETCTPDMEIDLIRITEARGMSPEELPNVEKLLSEKFCRVETRQGIDEVWSFFYDIRTVSFDQWWEQRKREAYVQDFTDLIEKDMMDFWQFLESSPKKKNTFLDFCLLYTTSLKGRVPKCDHLSGHGPWYIKISGAEKLSNKELTKSVNDFIKQKRKTSLKGKRTKYDDLELYLKLYDLWFEKKENGVRRYTNMEIIQMVCPPSKKASKENVKRTFNKRLEKAKTNIKYAALGEFPKTD